jgi:hypothetical protein
MDNFIKKLLSGKKSKVDIVDQLYKIPRKDTNGDNPTFEHISSGYIQFADTLYLPNDRGYIYALVLTDQGSRKVDLEPMKARSSTDIVDALKAIYKRKILSKPRVIVTDAGSEFKKDFDHALDNLGIGHKTAKTGRHRSVSLVERKNQTIGKILHKVMLQVELSTGNATSQWTGFARQLVGLINEKVVERNSEIKEIPIEKQVVTGNPDQTTKLLEIGDKVRVMLDIPQDLHGKQLIGRFRSGDIRWSREIRS